MNRHYPSSRHPEHIHCHPEHIHCHPEFSSGSLAGQTKSRNKFRMTESKNKNIHNSQLKFKMEVENKPKNYSLIIKIAVFGVALIITGTIVFQGNFLEGVLKLIGAGASQTEEIVISNVNEWRGKAGDWWVEDSSPKLENVEIIENIEPADPIFNGFLVPYAGVEVQGIKKSDLPSNKDESLLGDDSRKPKKETKPVETEKEYCYTSPVIDLGAEGSTLRSFTMFDIRPLGSEIRYGYRTGAGANLSGNFITIEDTSASLSHSNSQVIEHQSLQETPVSRYLQLEVTFLNVNPDNLTAVAEIKIAFQPADKEVVSTQPVQWGDMEKGNSQIAKEIIVDYNETTIINDKKGSVRINTAADGRKVARLDGVILSKHPRVVFEDVELLTGEEYVIVLEVPGMDRKILYFAASYEPEATYEFTFGALYPSADDSAEGDGSSFSKSADLNGDGSVNSIDYQLFLEQFGKTDFTSLDF